MSTGFRLIVMLFASIVLPVMAENADSYAPNRVVYDFSAADPKVLSNLLDRVSLLQSLYDYDSFDASIVIVLHEGAIPLFGKRQEHSRGELMASARSLTLGGVISFKICRASAKLQGFGDTDFQDFITMIPMADAEIVRLQSDGYAYMR